MNEKKREGKVAFCGRQMRRSNDCHVNSAGRKREGQGGGDLNRRTKLPGGALQCSLLTVDTHGNLPEEDCAMSILGNVSLYQKVPLCDTKCQFRRIALYCPSTP